MATKFDRKQILATLEDEYTRDLSLHLYSMVLLHRINPNFPKLNYSNWPLPVDSVPLPDTNYEDDIFIEEVGDIDLDEIRYENEYNTFIEKFTRSKSKNQLDIVTNDNMEVDNDHIIIPVLNKPIIDIEYREKLPNSKQALLNSISSLIETKIRSQLGSRHISVTNNKETLKYFSTRIANRFNSMLNLMVLSSKTPSWLYIIECAIRSEISPYKIINKISYLRLIEQCESMFNNISYRYQFESEPPRGVIKDSTFDVLEYLKSLTDVPSGKGQQSYKALYEQYLTKLNEKLEKETQLKHEINHLLQSEPNDDEHNLYESYLLK